MRALTVRTRTLALTALAALVALAPGCPPPGPGTFTLENDGLRVQVAGASGAFLSIFNKRTGQELIPLHNPGDTNPPWRLRRTPVPFLFPSDTRAYTSVQVTPSTIPGGDALDVVWTLAGSDQIVTRLELLDAEDELTMTANYVNNGSLYGAALDYPLLEGVGDLSQPGADSFLLSAQFHGLLYRNPFTLFVPGPQNGIAGGDYPTAVGGAMQTYAYFTEGVGGFQLLAEDPSNTVKNLVFTKDATNSHLLAYIRHRAWDLAPGSDLNLGYPIVLRALSEGNWYEAAERYREWATSTGPGAPAWTARGRLEDRVAGGDASQWLLEDVGISVLNLPASADVSAWVDAFHAAIPTEIFFIFGHDWANWSGASAALYNQTNALCLALGLDPYRDIPFVNPWIGIGSWPRDQQQTDGALTNLAFWLGGTVTPANKQTWRDLHDILSADAPWLAEGTPIQPFAPELFHAANVTAVANGGSRFTGFEYDHFFYGHDLDLYGIFSPATRDLGIATLNGALASIWMDPETPYWRDEKRARAVSQVAAGARAIYLDVTPNNPIMWASDRTDRSRPVGEGREIVTDYGELYAHMQAGANAQAGEYVPMGAEQSAEQLIPWFDYVEHRLGGHVQGDLEAETLVDWFESEDADEIPFFHFVYHEYGPQIINGWLQLGTQYGEIFYWIAAKTLLRGELPEIQYGTSSTDLFDGMSGPGVQTVFPGMLYEDPASPAVDPDKTAFLADVAQVRTSFGIPYLSYGKMQRPPAITSVVPAINLDWFHRKGGFIIVREEGGVITKPSVVSQAWTNTAAGTGAAFFVNVDDANPLPITADVDLGAMGLAGPSYNVSRVTLAGTAALGNTPGGGVYALSTTLGPREIVMVEFTP